jgi:hypothetical protein
VVKSAIQVGHFIFKPLSAVDGQAITFTKYVFNNIYVYLIDSCEVYASGNNTSSLEEKHTCNFD